MQYLRERVKKAADDLRKLIYVESTPVTGIQVRDGQYSDIQAVDAAPGSWREFNRQDLWGGFEQHAWFRFDVTVPQEMAGKPVCLCVGTSPIDWSGWDATNAQFIVHVDGHVKQGLDTNHMEVLLAESAVAGTVYRLDMHAYGGRAVAKGEKQRLSIDLAVIDRDVEKLTYDLSVPVDSLPLLSDESPSKHAVLKVLNDAVNQLDWRDVKSEAFQTSVREALSLLETELYGNLCGNVSAADAVTATCVGHTHIDVAWLWTVAQTREKVVRSFSTVLDLMDQYPEYAFMSSQPQLYEFLRQSHPELLERIKTRVAEGRWEAEGGMWLEADCNVTSGESLVRQLLHGKAFFRDTFGVDNKILWLPDVFGYSAALPQILKKSGIDYFMTTKIAWNQFNKLPYDVFNWRGMDGTEILTYFITTTDMPEKHFTTYNGNTDPASVKGAWTRFQQKDLTNDVMISFGHGDGGGGPTRGMLESARRLAKGIPGMPRVRMGTSLDFFERLERKLKNNPRLPKWVGELYLEYHRGTYTSMASNKRYNRKNEILWAEVEFLSVLAGLVGDAYPKDRIDAAWKIILLNQFHDILPGSSIPDVYEVCREEYEMILADGRVLASDALELLAKGTVSACPTLLAVNTQGFERDDLVIGDVPAGLTRPAILAEGIWREGQRIMAEEGERVLFFAPGVPARGYRSYQLGEMPEQACTDCGLDADGGAGCDDTSGCCGDDAWIVTTDLLENSFFRIALDEQGQFSSIHDKYAKREVLKPGEKGNVLVAFEDRPKNYDNWDIDMFYTEKFWHVDQLDGIEVTEAGPIRGTLRLRRKFMNCVIEQDIRLYRDIPRIDFETRVDWQLSQVLLKVAFPVDINADKATYEIQYGHVERPTHWNTSWDYARFEVCGHRWADLSEADYGVSLLNDCKYGHDIKDGTIRLTLIKSGIQPNPTTDRGAHEFTYSLYPHEGSWRDAGTLPMAASLNAPLKAVVSESKGDVSGVETVAVSMAKSPASAERERTSASWVSSDRKNVLVECVKQAEDGDGFIVRLYESENRRGPATLTFLRRLACVQACNLMEVNESFLPFEGNSLNIVVKPLEIQTYRVHFA